MQPLICAEDDFCTVNYGITTTGCSCPFEKPFCKGLGISAGCTASLVSQHEAGPCRQVAESIVLLRRALDNRVLWRCSTSDHYGSTNRTNQRNKLKIAHLLPAGGNLHGTQHLQEPLSLRLPNVCPQMRNPWDYDSCVSGEPSLPCYASCRMVAMHLPVYCKQHSLCCVVSSTQDPVGFAARDMQ